MKKQEPLESFNVAQAQFKIFEALTESMHDRMDQYSQSRFGHKVDFDYKMMSEQLIKDINLALKLCEKLENE